MKILIVYGTTEGHTRHICQYIQSVLSEADVSVTMCEAGREDFDPAPYDICFVAASLHVGSYQASIIDFASRHREVLTSRPNVFLSVSLSAAGENPADWEGLEECVARFVRTTGWTPNVIHHVAGAISYSHYDFFKRLALKFIAHRRGQETVTSRDYDLTDYDELKRFVLGFVMERQPVTDSAERRGPVCLPRICDADLIDAAVHEGRVFRRLVWAKCARCVGRFRRSPA